MPWEIHYHGDNSSITDYGSDRRDAVVTLHNITLKLNISLIGRLSNG